MSKLIQAHQIIEAAVKIAAQHGWEKTSVREISKAIGYSTIKIYSDFESKEGLLKAIQKQGFSLLRNEYKRSIQAQDTAEAKLVELTLAHYRFAVRQGAYYDLMFQMNGSTCALPQSDVLENASLPIRQLLETVAGKVDKALFFHWWALAHGFVTITQADKTREKEAIELLKVIVQQFIRGIQG